MNRLLPPSLLVLAFSLAFLGRVEMSLRPGLWGDEIFSLAMATGHSLEHPAAEADHRGGRFCRAAGRRVLRCFQALRRARHTACGAPPGYPSGISLRHQPAAVLPRPLLVDQTVRDR